MTTEEFHYVNGRLCAEGVPLAELARDHGTPLYVYSRSALKGRYQGLANAMQDVAPLICYSVKANSNAAVLKTFVDQGSGFDVVSAGELYRALRVGADPRKIVFAGVGKTRDEIAYALEQGILFFTVESEPEVQRISQEAHRLGTVGRIAFRINPDVDPKTHKYISTGKKENKFGLDIDRTMRAYRMAAALPGIEVAGLHMHIGSQLLSSAPFGEAIAKVGDFCRQLKQAYPSFKYLDIGGGIGIRYKPEDQALDPVEYAARVVPALKDLGLSVVLEPGRSMVGEAGVLVSRVQYVKENPFKKFVVVDAAMNDLIRPSLYQAYHHVLAVAETADTIVGDMVGPICESGDFLAQDRELPAVNEDDLVAVLSAGAYGFTMSSNYNSRPRAAEVMVDGTRVSLVRARETWDDLVRGERDIEGGA